MFIEKESFKKLIQAEAKNMFVFYRTECEVCDMFMEELKTRNIINFYAVNINKDIVFYKTELGIWSLPCTRIYMKDTVLWEKNGILYDKQIKEMFLVLNEGRTE